MFTPRDIFDYALPSLAFTIRMEEERHLTLTAVVIVNMTSRDTQSDHLRQTRGRSAHTRCTRTVHVMFELLPAIATACGDKINSMGRETENSKLEN